MKKPFRKTDYKGTMVCRFSEVPPLKFSYIELIYFLLIFMKQELESRHILFPQGQGKVGEF